MQVRQARDQPAIVSAHFSELGSGEKGLPLLGVDYLVAVLQG